MRNLKKILALVLALAMSLSLVTIASGIDLGDAEDIDHTEAVEVLTTLGVIQGYEDGNYYPDRVVKRSEMAKMITYILTGGKEPVLDSSNVSFGDTKGHWAAGYIEYCAAQGILNGYEDGNFYPERTVTASEAAKMILVTMNYDSKVFGFTGAGWAVNVAVEANKAGLYDELLGTNPSDGLDRDATAQMLYNGLTQMTMRLQYNHNIETGEVTQSYSLTGPSLLEDKFDASIEIGVLTSLNGNSKGFVVQDLDNGTTTIVNGNTVSFHSNVTNSDYTEDLTDLLGEEVRVIVRNNTSKNAVLGVYATGTSQVAYTTWNAIKADTTDSTEIAFGGKSYDIERPSATAAATPDQMLVNGSVSTASHFTNEKWNDVVKLVDIDGNGKYDIAFVTEIQMAKVTYVGRESLTVSKLGEVRDASISSSQDLEDVVVYDGIAKDDYVAIYTDLYTGKLTYTEASVATGTISGTKTVDGVNQYLIDGTWYKAAAGVNVTLEAGDTIDYVADAGLIYAAKITSGATGVNSLAMIITADTVKTSDNDTGGVGNLDGTVVKVKLLFADGSKKIVTLAELNDAPIAAGDLSTVQNEIGELVAFNINADGEYELSTIDQNDPAADLPLRGFDGAGTNAAYNSETIGGKELADDAVVFVLIGVKNTANGANDGKVYTGKEFKNEYTTYAYGTAVDNAASLYVTENGFQMAKAAAVTTNSTSSSPSITKGSNYGYLVADSYYSYDSESGKGYENYSIFNGENVITVKQENGDPIKAGIVITYDVVSDTEVKNVNIANVTTDAVTAWDNDRYIAFENDGSTRREITQDTVIIYVDSADKEAADGEGVAGISIADDPNADGVGYTPNVRYILSGNTVAFLLVDVNRDMAVNPATFQGTITDADSVNDALAAGWGVVDINANLTDAGTFNIGDGQTVNLTVDQTTAAQTFNLADGATLNINAAQTTKKVTVAVASGATLNINAALANTSVVTASAGANVSIPNGQILGAGAPASVSSGSITLTANASGGIDLAGTGTLQVTGNLTLGNSDVVNVTGSIVGTSGATITFRASTTLTSVGGTNNFYANTNDATADAAAAGTYTWTAFTETTGNTQVTGWLKTA